MKSSAVKGFPSDQRSPRRRKSVQIFPSSLSRQSLASEGAGLLPV